MSGSRNDRGSLKVTHSNLLAPLTLQFHSASSALIKYRANEVWLVSPRIKGADAVSQPAYRTPGRTDNSDGGVRGRVGEWLMNRSHFKADRGGLGCGAGVVAIWHNLPISRSALVNIKFRIKGGLGCKF